MVLALLLAATAAGGPPPKRCSLPNVLLGENDKAFTVRFWYGTPRRRDIEDSVRAAFKSACKYGLLKGSTVPALQGVSTRRLYLSNAPNANVASLYARDGRLILEYPYVAPDRSVHVPTPTEIQEAIYCAVHGASAKEQEESGRCLPD